MGSGYLLPTTYCIASMFHIFPNGCIPLKLLESICFVSELGAKAYLVYKKGLMVRIPRDLIARAQRIHKIVGAEVRSITSFVPLS